MTIPFTVQTTEGEMKGAAGDWLAQDPITGAPYIISDNVKGQTYRPFRQRKSRAKNNKAKVDE